MGAGVPMGDKLEQNVNGISNHGICAAYLRQRSYEWPKLRWHIAVAQLLVTYLVRKLLEPMGRWITCDTWVILEDDFGHVD